MPKMKRERSEWLERFVPLLRDALESGNINQPGWLFIYQELVGELQVTMTIYNPIQPDPYFGLPPDVAREMNRRNAQSC